jgi:hypothetical protein
MPKAVSSPHRSFDALQPRLQLVQAEPTPAQLVAWQKLWGLLLSEDGNLNDQGKTRECPAGGQDRTGLDADARERSTPMESSNI